MPNKIIVRPGDILVQDKGFPWSPGCEFLTGHRECHARIIYDITGTEISILEESPEGIKIAAYSVQIPFTFPLDYYIIRRPRLSESEIQAALAWMASYKGQPYDWERWAVIVAGTRLRLLGDIDSWEDDDYSKDSHPHICSELIALGFYRATVNRRKIVPFRKIRNTMPWHMMDVRCELDTVFQC